jgi:hypothetical protein
MNGIRLYVVVRWNERDAVSRKYLHTYDIAKRHNHLPIRMPWIGLVARYNVKFLTAKGVYTLEFTIMG